MKKNKKMIRTLLMFALLLIMTSCASKNKTIEAKYVSLYDKTSYLMFNKDGSFVNSLWTETNNGTEIVRDCFTYSVDKNNIITATDTTEYEGKNELAEYEIGILYKDYICVSCDGVLPKEYANTSISSKLSEDLILTYLLKAEQTYEFIVSSNDKILSTENGTYSINGNEVVCTSSDGIITTFVDIRGNTYCIEYIKED